MKPTALLLLAGIAICMLVVVFVPLPEQIPIPTTSAHLDDQASQSTKPSSITASADPADSPGSGGVNELQMNDQVSGDGEEAVPGKQVTVQYTGWLYDTRAADNKGLQFDSSRGREPFKFVLGRREVIAGWDEGVKGMKVGGKRILIIPSHMGYGPQGAGKIPPNAPLMFEVEVVSIQ
jgi:FKBP-type peptidyl-prolyl cis-trans isomerase